MATTLKQRSADVGPIPPRNQDVRIASAPNDPQIPTQLSMLNEVIGQQEKYLGELNAKLESVLGPDGPCSAVGGSQRASMSPLAESLESFVARVAANNDHIGRLISRLEL